MYSKTNLAKQNKSLFRELPYFGTHFTEYQGQFNNSFEHSLPTKRYFDRLTSLYDLD